MGGFRLEFFKFGMYVFFPIFFMGYFGVNLDERFAVPGFWPKPEEANTVPKEREEIRAELERLRARRLYLRDKRLAEEARRQAATSPQVPEPAPEQTPQVQPQQGKKGWW